MSIDWSMGIGTIIEALSLDVVSFCGMSISDDGCSSLFAKSVVAFFSILSDDF